MRSTMQQIGLTGAVMLGLVLAACGGTDRDPGGSPTATDGTTSTAPSGTTGGTAAPSGDGMQVDGAWLLQSGTVDGQDIPMPDGFPIDLVVDRDQVGGSVCNSWGGGLEVSGDRVSIRVDAMTEMACEGPVMQSERFVHEALGRVTTWERDGDELVLDGDGVRMQWFAQPAPDEAALTGTRWQLTSLASDDTASSVGGRGFVEFHEDGSFVGSTGCRALQGNWIRTGATISFTDLGAEGTCAPALSDQDGHVIGVLEDFSLAIDGDTLTLTSTSGGDALVFTAS